MNDQQTSRDRLGRWLHLDQFEDRQTKAQAVILYIAALIVVLAYGSFMVVQYFDGNYLDSLAMGVCFLLGGIVPVLVRRGNLRPAAWLLPLLVFAPVTQQVYIHSGIFDVGLLAYCAVIALGGLLLGRSGIVVFTLLSIAATAAIGYEQMTAMPVFTKEVKAERVMMIAVLLGSVGGFLLLLVNHLRASLLDLQQKERALGQANRELQTIQAGLEIQIHERTAALELARQESEEARMVVEAQVRLATSQARLGEAASGEQALPGLAANVIRELCLSMQAQAGTLFLLQDERLQLVGSYAYMRRNHTQNSFRLGEGLVGQAAMEKQVILLCDAPPGYMPVASGLLEIMPRYILAAPFLRDDAVIGVVEMAMIEEATQERMDFLQSALGTISIAFSTALARRRIDELLVRTRRQAEELHAHEQALTATNVELQAQTERLRASQEKLQRQQTELETVNAELEEKAAALQAQRQQLDRQNQELVAAQWELERKAEELTQISRYKSEFLANMSHELRTPLNSLLILAKMLSQNEAGNLTLDQVESARIIYNSGSDLLELINEILDLSKVEAGKMQFNFAPMSLENLAQFMQMQFMHVADEKGLEFQIKLAEDLPPSIESDQQRVQQILKNLLSNAFKFTSQGSVGLYIERPAAGTDLGAIGLPPQRVVAIRVTDTGIGMTPEQQTLVFEAFQQADGSTSRKYGGTGLGLKISRELALHLGGQLALSSELDKGSIFTLYLPVSRPADSAGAQGSPPEKSAAGRSAASPTVQAVPASEVKIPRRPVAVQRSAAFPDDREHIRPGDRVLLVIEDDPSFAHIVLEHAHKRDFKCLVALDGESGLQLVQKYATDAILLDLKLPGMSGWDVLDVLKEDSDTRHIPVHILSAAEETLDAYKRGAIGFLSKPVSSEALEGVFGKLLDFASREIKNLLIVEDDTALRHSVRQLLGGSDVRISEAARGAAALSLLHSLSFDCMILDLNLPDMSGFDLLSQMNADADIHKCPVIVYTGQALSEEENLELMKYADSVIIKGVKSPERLLDETSLFLHRVVAEMPDEKQRTIKRLHDREAILADKHILVVDDDMRNAFAVSKLLGEKGLKVSIARSGQKALEMLAADEAVDLVLMDIMMPEMDGYETMRRIRAQARFRSLPILALTAKAMKGDQEKCIAAGANDYLSKPVDTDRLLSMLRVWLYR